MDPFEALHVDVLAMIFQNLTVRDLLRASEVSPTWENIIGKSADCMKKVWLRFYDPLNDVERLMNSKRKYQNCKIQRGLRVVLSPVFVKFRWRQVMMRDDDIRSEDYVELMKYLAPSIEALDIWNVKVSAPEILSTSSIDFPRLKKLEHNLSSRCAFLVFFGKNPKLRGVKLAYDTADFHPDMVLDMLYIHRFFSINPQIEKLELLSIHNLFDTDLSKNVSFRLKSFSFDINFNSEGEVENLLKFFGQQNLLDEITIYTINDWTTLAALWNALQHVGSWTFHHTSSKSVQMNVNENLGVKKIVLHSSNSMYNQLIGKSPHLKKLCVNGIMILNQ